MKIKYLLVVPAIVLITQSSFAGTYNKDKITMRLYKACQSSYFYDEVNSSKRSIIEHYCKKISESNLFHQTFNNLRKKYKPNSNSLDQNFPEFYQLALQQCQGTASPKVDVDSFELSYKVFKSLSKDTCTKALMGQMSLETSDATTRIMISMSDEDFEKYMANAADVFEYCANPYRRNSSPARDKLLLQKAAKLLEMELLKMPQREQQRLITAAKNFSNGIYDPNYCDFNLLIMKSIIDYKGYDRTDIISAIIHSKTNQK